jgi:hypothetical protein
VILCVLAGVGAARTAEVAGALAAPGSGRAAAAARLSGAALSLLVIALLAAPLIEDRAGRLDFEVREVGRRMDLQQGLERVVKVAGGAEALRALGSVTTNRSLHTRLAWELGYPIQDIERGYGHHVIIRTYEEGMAGNVLVWGTPRLRRLVARAGSFVAYQRVDVSYRLVTAPLQGFNIRREGAGNPGAG